MSEKKKVLFLSNHFKTLFWFRKELIKELIEENKQISDKNDKLQQENAELKAALEQLAKTIKENQDGQM